MERILFVTGNAGGVEVETVQHRGPAEIEWWFLRCAQLIFKKVCEGDRGNHMEEPRLFPAQDTT